MVRLHDCDNKKKIVTASIPIVAIQIVTYQYLSR